MKADLQKLGLAIKGARTQAGLSQLDLARRSGVGKSAVQQIESSATDPRFGTVLALAVGLDVDGSGFPVESLARLIQRAEFRTGRRRKTEDADKALLAGLGMVIERERKKKRWTRQKLARAAGLVPNTISALESGEQEPTWGNLRLLAQGLGMELEDLNNRAIDLAPGPGGDELRRDHEEATVACQRHQDEKAGGAAFDLPRPSLDTFGKSELADLATRSAHLLRLRTGMHDGKVYTLKEAGEKLKIGPERARQLQNEGLALIRQMREVQRSLRRKDEVTIRRAGRR